MLCPLGIVNHFNCIEPCRYRTLGLGQSMPECMLQFTTSGASKCHGDHSFALDRVACDSRFFDRRKQHVACIAQDDPLQLDESPKRASPVRLHVGLDHDAAYVHPKCTVVSCIFSISSIKTANGQHYNLSLLLLNQRKIKLVDSRTDLKLPAIQCAMAS